MPYWLPDSKIVWYPKKRSLENAYNFLGVNMHASNFEINKAFHKLCLMYHPDKGGNESDFIKLQAHMGVIKLAREEGRINILSNLMEYDGSNNKIFLWINFYH